MLSNVENIYHLITTAVNILDSYHSLQQLLSNGDSVTLPLLSRYYVRLTQTYECLANALRRDLQLNSDSTIMDSDSMLHSPVTLSGMKHCTSAGAAHLAMPAKAKIYHGC